MPLRKKHVQRAVVLLLAVGIIGPAAALVWYGLHVRGGAYGRAVEQTLASRLRCEARIVGCRPTGPRTAAADEVRLSWATADGRLTLHLRGLTAESNAYGWYVRAADGWLSLAGADPPAALAALNQRLVQIEHPSQFMALTVERLRLSLDLGVLKVERETRVLALPNMTVFVVSLFDPDTLDKAARSTLTEGDIGLLATVRLDSTSPKGVFDGLHVALKNVPLGSLRKALVRGGDKTAEEARGTADLTVDWHGPETDARAATVAAVARGIDLAQWTQGMPGGPITGTADLHVRYAKAHRGPPALTVRLESNGGTVSGKTLAWLDGLRAGAEAIGADRVKTVPFDRLDARFNLVAGVACYVGEKDAWGAVPLLTVRILGVDVPLLRAGAQPFSCSGLWPALSEGLGLGAGAVPQPK